MGKETVLYVVRVMLVTLCSVLTDDSPAAKAKHKPDVARGSRAKKKADAGAGAGSGGPA